LCEALSKVLEQHIPADIQGSSQPDQNGERTSKITSFDHLQVARCDTGLLGQPLLGKTGGIPQSAKIASKNIQLLLRETFHE
jgi:hypothetical protein